MWTLSQQKAFAFHLTLESEHLLPVGQEVGQHFMPPFGLNIEAAIRLNSAWHPLAMFIVVLMLSNEKGLQGQFILCGPENSY